MHGKKGTDVRTSSRTSYCLYDVRRRRVRDSDVLVDVQRLVRRFPSNAGAMGVFMRILGAAGDQEGPGCRPLEEETEGVLSNTESPRRSRQHPQKYRSRPLVLRIAVDSESQRRVPRRRSPTQRVGQCRTECWGPGLGCAQRKSWKSAQKHEQLQITQYTGLLSGVGRQGLTSTKFGQKGHWTVGDTWTQLLCSRDQARQDERGPRGPVMQKFGAGVGRGKILSTHGKFLLGFQCRVMADSPQSMHHQETVENAGRMRCYNVAGCLLATLLQFCRRPGAVSGRPLAEIEEGSAEKLW
ncbi:hypothetical protein NDU88_002911 [Pleurodeles waltl]|uniref:Uncharacterized protein n=1 Tax=Pleurodeles waltl TaxID=8319 RepID=A0AAV7T391_PLEWA|nr:hypothetical protein NDU88_002911 [Pleurodeles waltl]